MTTTLTKTDTELAQHGGEIAVHAPASGEEIGRVEDLGTDAVRALVARARAAQPAWEALGFDGRAAVLRRMQGWLIANRERVIATICAETGKPYEDAQLAEVAYGAGALRFWAKHAERYLADERVRGHNPFLLGKKLRLSYRPLGVVGVIGPWNFPLANSFGDAIPALMAGNTIVLKPSELTPLTSLLLREGLIESGLPADVFLVATGRGETGAALVDHVDMVMFTGSTATGRRIAIRAAESLIAVSLELGGKDPMIVCADADLEKAANAATYWGLMNSGQICISVERVYVEAPVYDAFVAKVAAKVAALRQGVPDGPGSVELGAITMPAQLDLVDAHVRDARERGARILTGGQRPDGPGLFYPPTVIADADHSMRCMREETFGPTLPIMRVADAEEAVRLANDSPYGLGASVYTQDTRKGERIARAICSGAVCVNDALMNYFALALPMGGRKESGLGARHGADGIRKYCAKQAILVSRFGPRRELQMFPYRPTTSRLLGRAVALIYGRRRSARGTEVTR